MFPQRCDLGLGAALTEAAFMSLAEQRRKRTRLKLHRRAPSGVHDAVAIKIPIGAKAPPTVCCKDILLIAIYTHLT